MLATQAARTIRSTRTEGHGHDEDTSRASDAPTSVVRPVPAHRRRRGPRPRPPGRVRRRADHRRRDERGRSPVVESESVTGAQALVRSLEALGVDVMFGIPGGAILPAYDPLFDSNGPAHPGPPRAGRRPRRHRLRAGHRQGRRLHGHLRAGRDQPGHPDRRRVHGLGRRWSRSPARCRSGAIGTDAFQEADIQGITLPITKHNYLVQTAEELPRVLAEAFHLAGTGRPGPVLVDIPKDVLQARTDVLLAAHAGPARLPADAAPARQADPRGGPADRDGPPAGALRRRRRAQGRRVTGAARAGRADRRPGGHHADGPRRVPGQRTRSTWACPACTARSPRSTRCRRPT